MTAQKTLVSLNDFNTIFTIDTCDIRISTRVIAKHFGQQHSTILRAVDNAECSREFREYNFVSSNYLTMQGKSTREVLLTEKGFNFIVLAFKGKKAAQYREAYIEAFDALKKYYIKKQKRSINKAISRNSEFITEAINGGWTKERIKKDLKKDSQKGYDEILEMSMKQFDIR